MAFSSFASLHVQERKMKATQKGSYFLFLMYKSSCFHESDFGMCTLLSLGAMNVSACVLATVVYVNVLGKFHHRRHKGTRRVRPSSRALMSPPSMCPRDCCLCICLLWESFFTLLRGLFSLCVISLGEQYSIEITKP